MDAPLRGHVYVWPQPGVLRLQNQFPCRLLEAIDKEKPKGQKKNRLIFYWFFNMFSLLLWYKMSSLNDILLTNKGKLSDHASWFKKWGEWVWLCLQSMRGWRSRPGTSLNLMPCTTNCPLDQYLPLTTQYQKVNICVAIKYCRLNTTTIHHTIYDMSILPTLKSL